MGIKDKLHVLERIDEIATLAGIKGRVNEDQLRFEMGFGLDNGRSQVVYVRDISPSPDRPIVSIFSPCLIRKNGLRGGISKKMALDLLHRNECVRFARYGVAADKKSSIVIASIDHMVDSLDPSEFEASAYHVAMAADLYEREHGQDEF